MRLNLTIMTKILMPTTKHKTTTKRQPISHSSSSKKLDEIWSVDSHQVVNDLEQNFLEQNQLRPLESESSLSERHYSPPAIEKGSLLSKTASAIKEISEATRQLTLPEIKTLMNSVWLNQKDMMSQLFFIIFQAQKANPKTGELYFDADVALKGLNLAFKMTKSYNKEPEIIQPIFIRSNWIG